MYKCILKYSYVFEMHHVILLPFYHIVCVCVCVYHYVNYRIYKYIMRTYVYITFVQDNFIVLFVKLCILCLFSIILLLYL